MITSKDFERYFKQYLVYFYVISNDHYLKIESVTTKNNNNTYTQGT